MGIRDIYAKIVERKNTKASLVQNDKYYLSTEEEDTMHIINAEGERVTLHRIVAKESLIGGATGRYVFVKKGDKGGFVQSEENLAATGLCWIYDNAIVYGGAKVLGDAKVRGEAVVRDNAVVCDKATVASKAMVAGDVTIRDNARVGGQAKISGNVVVEGFAQVKDNAMACDHATISDFAQVCNNSIVAGQANICGTAAICSSYNLKDATCSIIFDNATIDSAFVYESAVFGNAHIQGQYGVKGQSITRENQHRLAGKYDVSLSRSKVGGTAVIQNNFKMENSKGGESFNFCFPETPFGIKINSTQIKDDAQIVLDSPNKVSLLGCYVEGGAQLDTSKNVQLFSQMLTDEPFAIEEDAAQ